LKERGLDPQTPEFILKMIHDWNTTTLLMHNRDRMPSEEAVRFRRAIERVADHEPPQYVVGKAPFYGRMFIVSRDVLIPESETEELVEWVLDTMPKGKPLRVLDLGTGSGVIGITLKLERPLWQVTLSDISAGALRVATANQRLHGTNLPEIESDMFARLADQKFDLIVTNPPYIATSEISLMDKAVLDYEPPVALFADEHGLGFYHRLFESIGDHLTPHGQLFGETGFDQEQSIQDLCHQVAPYAQIETRHDMADRMRMIHAWNF
jgi:release factor glutamine methyltransferase